MATNAGSERQFASMEEGQRLQRQLEEGGLGQIVADYCTQNPIVCASWAAVVLKGGGGDASPKFKQCQDTCTVTQQPSLVSHCQATCYQYINL
jgi:hypothetical protein